MNRQERIRALGIAAAGCLTAMIAGCSVTETGRNADVDALQQEIVAFAEDGNIKAADETNPLIASGEQSAAIASERDGTQVQSGKTTEAKQATAPHDVSGNSLYRSVQGVSYGSSGRYTQETAESVLAEMRDFWEQNGFEAVCDLWKLRRYLTMSAQLTAEDDGSYFYCGERNSGGEPEGKGIAVYGGNRYYYGEWKNGLREGAGEWVQFYPEEMQDVVRYHFFTGTWAGNLPNGEGTELYEYDNTRMDGVSLYAKNVIGSFADGMYDGLMYVILEDESQGLHNWYGVCDHGTWQVIDHADADGKIPVLWEEHDMDSRISMWPEYCTGYGVYHLE